MVILTNSRSVSLEFHGLPVVFRVALLRTGAAASLVEAELTPVRRPRPPAVKSRKHRLYHSFHLFYAVANGPYQAWSFTMCYQ